MSDIKTVPQEVLLDGKVYRLADEEPGDLTLIVMERGFIFVGEWNGKKLTNASNVRRWERGGFGGLTKSHSEAGAELDSCGDIEPVGSSVLFTVRLPRGW